MSAYQTNDLFLELNKLRSKLLSFASRFSRFTVLDGTVLLILEKGILSHALS